MIFRYCFISSIILLLFIQNIVAQEFFTLTELPFNATYQPVIGDFDGDGNADIAMGTTDNQLMWLKNDGTGTFTEVNVIDQIGDSYLVTMDMDNDGDLDLLIHNLIYENDGNGNFSNNGTLPYYINEGQTNTFGDMNGDGLPDCADVGYQEIVWFENLGNLTFSDEKNRT